MNFYRSILPGFIAFTLLGCGQEDEQQATIESAGTVSLQFKHMVGNTPFTNESNMVTSQGDTLLINDLAYYISNVAFVQPNGSEYKVPNSYHLIRQTDKFGQNTRLVVDLQGVPQGTYSKLRFSVGVDSSRNFNIAKVGDLDPNGLMTWPWSIGYKYFVIEGRQIDASDTAVKSLVFHIGRLPNYKVLEHSLNYQVGAGSKTRLNVTMDLNKVFYNPTVINLKTTSNVMEAPKDQIVANNYATAFTVSLAQNP